MLTVMYMMWTGFSGGATNTLCDGIVRVDWETPVVRVIGQPIISRVDQQSPVLMVYQDN